MEQHDNKHDAAQDEPQTPMWLPILGIALFLIVGIYWATRPVPRPPPAPAAPPASVAPAASAR